MAYRSRLRDAAELIFTPEGKLNPRTWCQGSPARDCDGRLVHYSDPRAVRFCSMGALWRANGGLGNSGLSSAARNLFGMNIVKANDHYPDLLPDIWSEAIEADEALNGGE